jgi:hypothetical protein
MTRSARLTRGLLIVAVLCVGCSYSGSKPTPAKISYYVYVVNHMPSDLRDVDIKFDDGNWTQKIGELEVGSGRTYDRIDGTRPLPKTVTLDWRSADGGARHMELKVPEKYRGKPPGKTGRLEIAFESDNYIAIVYKDDR